LRSPQPEPDAPDLVVLRFAFVTRGPGDHIFPSLVVDDWGREMRALTIYQWVRENGDRFPRSEIFGYEQDGRETQVFLREMELMARLPCYAYADDQAAVTEGLLLHTILLEDAQVDAPVRSGRPPELPLPLRAARVNWWKIPPGLRDIDLAMLSAQADSGA